jgi:aconitate hydratase
VGVPAVVDLVARCDASHRSSVIGMGILPRQFKVGEPPGALGLTGRESYTIEGIAAEVSPGKPLTICAKRDNGSEPVLTVITRIETPDEVAYYRHGGILPYVPWQLLQN